MATESTQEATTPAQRVAKKQPAGRSKPERPRAKRAAKPSKAKKPRTAPATSAPKAKARRKQSTPAKRAKIIAAADREGLTALQVQKRFGVKPVTYYSWRKKLGMKGRRGRKPAAGRGQGTALGRSSGLDLAGHVRQALRAEIAKLLPGMIAAEVASILGRK